jgi:hypothetical protein
MLIINDKSILLCKDTIDCDIIKNKNNGWLGYFINIINILFLA